eukprot:TRINITY_DN4244_c0_g1_i2.p1 TRINITY_DN4244_c0_g1~~TRINITY_DN4244_c0_g1_i2.p1  ORF type:complete len:261 (-),score=83.19 TRINITY_DN4244_c0_g1_i2:144-833(-)
MRIAWAIWEILRQPQPKDRALAMHRILLTIDACYSIRNYNAAIALMSVLDNSAVHRLRGSLALLPPSTWDLYDKYTKMFNSQGNFKTYREILAASITPCIPYLGSYLTDVVFVSDGNPTLIPNTNLINFVKCRNLSNILKPLQQFQSVGPTFVTVGRYQEWLDKSAKEAATHSEQEFYDTSLEYEPQVAQPKPLTKEAKAAAEKLSKEIFPKDAAILKKAKLAATKTKP